MALRWSIGLLDIVIDGIGIYDLRLSDGFVESGKIERFLVIEDGDFTMGDLTDNYFGSAKGIGRAVGLDLVDDIVEMDGQILGDCAGLLPVPRLAVEQGNSDRPDRDADGI